jgi:hypothetical protein
LWPLHHSKPGTVQHVHYKAQMKHNKHGRNWGN